MYRIVVQTIIIVLFLRKRRRLLLHSLEKQSLIQSSLEADYRAKTNCSSWLICLLQCIQFPITEWQSISWPRARRQSTCVVDPALTNPYTSQLTCKLDEGMLTDLLHGLLQGSWSKYYFNHQRLMSIKWSSYSHFRKHSEKTNSLVPGVSSCNSLRSVIQHHL